MQNAEENKIVEKILKKMPKKKLSQSSERSPKVLLPGELPADLPPILRSNPHPEYIELWTINKNAFWKKYWMDKKNGTVKYASRRFTVAGGKKGQWNNGLGNSPNSPNIKQGDQFKQQTLLKQSPLPSSKSASPLDYDE